MEHGEHPGQHHQGETGLRAHDSSAVQGEADGHIAVISLGNKENSLKTSRKQEEVYLNQAACKGNGWNFTLYVLELCDREKAEFREGKILRNKYTVV